MIKPIRHGVLDLRLRGEDNGGCRVFRIIASPIAMTAQHQAFRYPESSHSEGLMDALCICRHDQGSKRRMLHFAVQQIREMRHPANGQWQFGRLVYIGASGMQASESAPRAPKKKREETCTS
ncbi:hypothetical protein [Bradyrhizobium sp. BWA-3-5]|uniref:hypothetical protein n=1 Tax=Bradyrhizobium sp. BWA-3-5 TaxID=3080013 RepID=UPI00293F1FC6|nr:hypothetical protein [Bradyrhizobium sp. BWA-3-5]WOH67790.1 hypothetical protein RX331_08610 [Bradyrhizobium sp. BWA-3-5]